MKWNVKILKKFIEQRLDLMDDAQKLARKLMNRRLRGMNEVREQLDRQIKTFVTKDELKLSDQKRESLSKLVYIGLGVFLVIQIILVLIMAKVL